MQLDFPHHFQKKRYTCGPASIRAVAEFFNKTVSERELERRVLVTKIHGTSRKNMIALLRSAGLQFREKRFGSLSDIVAALKRGNPVIVNYRVPKYEEDHYAVVKGVTQRNVYLSDPSRGKHFQLSRERFLSRWRNIRLNKKYTGWMVEVSGKE